MKFGKHIQSQQVPGWSAYYLDYKFLKKIISSLAANRPASEAALLALGIRPGNLSSEPVNDNRSEDRSRSPSRPPLDPAFGRDEAQGPDFQAHKAAFFFKLERELEKINAFYLEREAQLKLRLEALLSKRRAAAIRGLPDTSDVSSDAYMGTNAEWNAVVEGFKLLERDLGKLQQFVEINATGFRKILKKYDKRSISTTKELYLSRQVDVQPVFNRQLISELSDAVAACLIDVTDLSSCIKFETATSHDIFAQQIMVMSQPTRYVQQRGPFHDFEHALRKAVSSADRNQIQQCVQSSNTLIHDQKSITGEATNVTRILWKIILDAPWDLADLILASLEEPFEFGFVDDINGRTCLHEAAIVGNFRLVELCLEQGVQPDKADSYGRSALHYACMNDHGDVCGKLLRVGVPPDTLDADNYSPPVYALMKGSQDCVQALLDTKRVLINRDVEPFPLHIASQSGFVDIVSLLLMHGASSRPNTNGEYPIHLAAKAGHVETCRLLLDQEGWDTPDKYHEWTPLTHAARYGHSQCIQVLLDAGCRSKVKDELGHYASHYAAWYGHLNCLRLILLAMPDPTDPTSAMPIDSPDMGTGVAPDDIDFIPSLCLPPPIMSHRIYGHNYLDKTHLVQISILGSWTNSQFHPGVKLHHRLMDPVFRDEYLLAPAPLKLVTSTNNKAAHSAPMTISLPQLCEAEVFSFKTTRLEEAAVEFSVYPNFGTKTIGRAVVLASVLVGSSNERVHTIPILDSRLNVIGEVSFRVNVITAFGGVTLQVGGNVETYWKSPLAPGTGASGLLPAWSRSLNALSTTTSSPASIANISTPLSAAGTASSLQGEYLYTVIQFTKDLKPVVYKERLLPVPDFELSVGDVTLAQFEALAARKGRGATFTSVAEWQAGVGECIMSLETALRRVPSQLGLCLEIVHPSNEQGRHIDLNAYVDAVLHRVFEVPASLDVPKRKIVFTSFHPDVCSLLNWKQPNYAVFFASTCGQTTSPSFSPASPSFERLKDRRATSLHDAVIFAKDNNLLGILMDADLLARVPSLVERIRGEGLLIAVWGANDPKAWLQADSGAPRPPGPVEACLKDGLVAFAEHVIQEL